MTDVVGVGSVQRWRAVAGELVGRDRELELIWAAVAAGRDLLLEGPPGTSKSTILRAITSWWGIPFVLVEGNADLTPAKLVGHHNPARVLQEDYSPDNFVAGPLTAAMQDGGFLYIEEFNRTPEDTLNTLLTAMSEREVTIPRVGRIVAADSFRLVASMNPFDNVGTNRVSASIYDRLCRLAVGYQDEEEERQIVAWRSGVDDPQLVADAVGLVRASRAHPDVRLGASVRGAIDLVLIADQLVASRGRPAERDGWARLLLDAALLALSGRLRLHDTTDTTPEQVVRELWEDRFVLRIHRPPSRAERIVVADPAILHHRDTAAAPDPSRRQLARRPKQLEAAPHLYRATEGGFVLTGADDSRGASLPDGEAAGSAAVATTDEPGHDRQLDGLLEDVEVDPDILAMAERITRNLSVGRRHPDREVAGGSGSLHTVPYRYRSDEIDLDATLEVLTERPVPDDTDILVRERRRSRRAVALIGDVSGSMDGEKARITAAAIGALCGELSDDELAVVAFWKHAAVVQPLAEAVVADRVLRDLLRLPARGLTNVHFGLAAGLVELQRARARRRTAILLSDVVHNAGPDPRDAAARFERLHVLLEVDGEHDADLARELARAGGGMVLPVRDHTEAPAALNRLLAS